MFESIVAIARWALCLVSPVVTLRFLRWLPVWIPFLPVAGTWVMELGIEREFYFLQSYLEFGVILALLAWWSARGKSRTSLRLFGLPLLALPAMVLARDHFWHSAFLMFLLVGGGAVYQYFYEGMDYAIRRRVITWAALTWTSLGCMIKLYDAFLLGGIILYQRGGSIWGSNHVGGILFLLLPLVRSKWVSALALVYLLLNFSRGIYVGLIVYAVAWILWVDPRRAIRIIGTIAAAILMLLLLLPSGMTKPIADFAVERIAYQSFDMRDVTVASILDRALSDKRLEIFDAALVVAKRSHWVGVGPGGFYWALEEAGIPMGYSNAHNLYLTALAEGGILYTLAFVLLLASLLMRAYRVDRRVFAGLVSWCVYGLFSGQLYEATRFVTAGDYYCLLLVFAYVAWKAEHGDPARRGRGARRGTPSVKAT